MIERTLCLRRADVSTPRLVAQTESWLGYQSLVSGAEAV